MRHLTIESLIGLSEGTLSPRDKQDVEDHMLNCAQCFAEASEFLVVELQTCLESRTKFYRFECGSNLREVINLSRQ